MQPKVITMLTAMKERIMFNTDDSGSITFGSSYKYKEDDVGNELVEFHVNALHMYGSAITKYINTPYGGNASIRKPSGKKTLVLFELMKRYFVKLLFLAVPLGMVLKVRE